MNLKVTFRGLCNYVPVFAGAAQNQLDNVWVLLVNARDGRNIPRIDGETGPRRSPAHFAYVRYRLAETRPGAPEDLFGLWPLHGTDLRVLDGNGRPLAGGPTLRQAPSTNPNQPRVGTDEETSFDWVVSTGRAGAAQERVHGDCIASDRQQVPLDRVSARLQIFAGELSTVSIVTRPGTTTPMLFDFGAGDPRALAREVAWTVEVPTDDIVLERTIRSDGTVDRLVLTPAAGDEVEISILNLEPEALLEERDQRRVPPRRIEEFRWFYPLTSGGIPVQPPVVVPVARSSFGGGDPYCPQSRSAS